MGLVYVASAFVDAPLVRDVHATLLAWGLGHTSRWAEAASKGVEGYLGDSIMRELAEANDRDILRADAFLILAREGVGGEAFAELRYALEHGKPAFYVGERKILSAYRSGVVRCDAIADAIGLIARAFPKSEGGS